MPITLFSISCGYVGYWVVWQSSGSEPPGQTEECGVKRQHSGVNSRIKPM